MDYPDFPEIESESKNLFEEILFSTEMTPSLDQIIPEKVKPFAAKLFELRKLHSLSDIPASSLEVIQCLKSMPKDGIDSNYFYIKRWLENIQSYYSAVNISQDPNNAHISAMLENEITERKRLAGNFPLPGFIENMKNPSEMIQQLLWVGTWNNFLEPHFRAEGSHRYGYPNQFIENLISKYLRHHSFSEFEEVLKGRNIYHNLIFKRDIDFNEEDIPFVSQTSEEILEVIRNLNPGDVFYGLVDETDSNYRQYASLFGKQYLNGKDYARLHALVTRTKENDGIRVSLYNPMFMTRGLDKRLIINNFETISSVLSQNAHEYLDQNEESGLFRIGQVVETYSRDKKNLISMQVIGYINGSLLGKIVSSSPLENGRMLIRKCGRCYPVKDDM